MMTGPEHCHSDDVTRVFVDLPDRAVGSTINIDGKCYMKTGMEGSIDTQLTSISAVGTGCGGCSDIPLPLSEHWKYRPSSNWEGINWTGCDSGRSAVEAGESSWPRYRQFTVYKTRLSESFVSFWTSFPSAECGASQNCAGTGANYPPHLKSRYRYVRLERNNPYGGTLGIGRYFTRDDLGVHIFDANGNLKEVGTMWGYGRLNNNNTHIWFYITPSLDVPGSTYPENALLDWVPNSYFIPSPTLIT